MRLSSLFLAGLLLAAGCGGRTNAYLGSVEEGGASGGGSSSGNAGSSGAGSSGVGSASSSGFTGSSSSGASGSSSSSSGFGSSGTSSSGFGGTSSSSGSGGSSGGLGCEPLPGCTSSSECPEPNGCGICFCDGGGWECDDLDAGLSCPSEPPVPGSFCSTCQGSGCAYGGFPGETACGVVCDCEDSAWQCSVLPCAPPPVCPPFPPSTGSPCFVGVGGTCVYDLDGSCSDADECVCDPSGTFTCFDPFACPGEDGGEFDTGPPVVDSGPPDGGGGPCPEQQPVSGSPCADNGFVCSYFPGCEVNCLCAENAWVCASQGGPCAMGDE